MLIRGGTLVDADGERQVELLLTDGRVAGQFPPGEGGDADPETIDATGLYLLPGVVDPHTHFSLDTGSGRTVDDFFTGSGSAAAGGVTTYINFATQHPGQTFAQALDAVRREAARSLVDWSLHLNITRLDDGWERELERVVDHGVSSVKVYTTYKDSVFYADDHLILRLMERSGGAGLLVQMHAENDDILAGTRRELVAAKKTSFAYHAASRPPLAESEAVNRGLFFSRVTGSPIYFVHLSSPLSVDLVTDARQRGIPAIAETCPHFLCLDESVYARPDAVRFLMTPPIRSAEMREGLWQRMERGEIHSVGSDHCGYSLEQRGDSGDFTTVSPGIPGVETSLPLLYTFGVEAGRIGMRDLVRLLCENPARIFGLHPRKGNLAIGSDADVVLFDPHAAGPLSDEELHTAAGFSPYAGVDLKGRVRTTICRGRVVYDRGQVTGSAGWGRFVERLPFGPGQAAQLPGVAS